MNLKTLLLKPIVVLIYNKMIKSPSGPVVAEDLRYWSMKIFGEEKPLKPFFISKFMGNSKFRTFYHMYKCNTLIKKVFPPADMLSFRPNTKIAPGGLFLVHPWCTRIGAKSIGKNCIIRHLTTIGTNGRPDMENLTPRIGDNVDIGAMCVITGDITVGNNVKIGVGTILTKSVPDNCVVVGNPARIIKKDGQRVDIKL